MLVSSSLQPHWSIKLNKAKDTPNTFFNLVTLTFKLDLDILPLDVYAENQVSMSVCSVVRVVTGTHRQTDDVKTITPVADAGCKKLHTLWKLRTEVTPRCILVFLSFFFCMSTDMALGGQWNVPTNIFWNCDLDIWPKTFTYGLALNILPLDIHAKIDVRTSIQTHRHRHRHTMSKLLHPTCQRRGV